MVLQELYLLVVAKTSAAAHLWTGIIASGQVKKEYQALCFGLVQGLKSNSALGKTGRLTQRVQVAGAGKTAETFYQVAGIFPAAEIAAMAEQVADLGNNPLFSLLNLTLGRRHCRIFLGAGDFIITCLGCSLVHKNKAHIGVILSY